MSEYVKREAVLKSLEYCPIETSNADLVPAVLETIRRKIVRLPYMAAAPVVHGEWKYQINNGVYEAGCSNCGYFPGIRFWSSPYCPNCGAKMDG